MDVHGGYDSSHPSSRGAVVHVAGRGQVLYWELHPDLMEGEISKQDKIVNLLPLVALATLVVCGIAIRFI